MTPTLDDALDPPTFVVRFVGVAGPCPPGWALAGDGRRWYRRAGESDQAFEDRVLSDEPTAQHLVFFPVGTESEDRNHERQDQAHRRRTLGIARRA